MCDGFCPQSRPLLQPLRGDTARFGLLDGIVSGIQEATKEVTVQHVLVPTKDKAASVFAGVKECGVESIGRFAQEASECGSAKKRPDAKMSQLRGEPGELSFRRGQMAKEFESVAFEAPLKVVQEPFKTQFGWHVMVVNKRTPLPIFLAGAGIRSRVDSKAVTPPSGANEGGGIWYHACLHIHPNRSSSSPSPSLSPPSPSSACSPSASACASASASPSNSGGVHNHSPYSQLTVYSDSGGAHSHSVKSRF